MNLYNQLVICLVGLLTLCEAPDPPVPDSAEPGPSSSIDRSPTEEWGQSIETFLREIVSEENNMLQKMKQKWERLVEENKITVGEIETERGTRKQITFDGQTNIELKECYQMLQGFGELFPTDGRNNVYFEIKLKGGKEIKFALRKAAYGKNQILYYNRDGTAIDYKTISRVLDGGDSKQTAKLMLELWDKPISEISQMDFPGMTEAQIEKMFDFMTIQSVCEAAIPNKETSQAILDALAENKAGGSPEEAKKIIETMKKSGRVPLYDKFVRSVIKESIDKCEADKTDFKFNKLEDRLLVMKKGGTKRGREQMIDESGGSVSPPRAYDEERLPSSEPKAKVARLEETKKAEDEAIGKKIKDDMGKHVCSSPCIYDTRYAELKPGSVRVEDNKIKFTVIDKKKPGMEREREIRLEDKDLVHKKYLEELYHDEGHGNMEVRGKESPRVRSSGTAKFSRALGAYGLVAGIAGAGNAFASGQTARGVFYTSQSLHILGSATGFNKIASKVSKSVTRQVLSRSVERLGVQRLAERLTESAAVRVGERLLSTVPVVGVAFDIEFLREDIENIVETNFSSPWDLEFLPMKVVDLGLDAALTALDLVGPESEPLVLALSLIRMSFDTFYQDIDYELHQVNWKSPLAPLEAIGAIYLGILEGAADFFTGGMISSIRNLDQEHNANQQLLRQLSSADNYYKLSKEDDTHSAIDLTAGAASLFGGAITLRMGENQCHLTVRGTRTVETSFPLNAQTQDVIMGIGESRQFSYSRKSAKLFWFIPVKSYDIICGENLESTSLHGTYIGNDNNNRFFAVQAQPDLNSKRPSAGASCAEKYGQLDFNYAIQNYHYQIYGNGGNDSFFLGPQSSEVTGGEGTDFYMLSPDGGVAVIDNFAHDGKTDTLMLNVPFSGISCAREGEDLHVTFSRNHYIHVKHWFSGGTLKNHQHMTFRANDGVIFSPEDLGFQTDGSHRIECRARIIEKVDEPVGQTIDLRQEVFQHVIQVIGSPHDDVIYGSDLENFFDGDGGSDYLEGGNGADVYVLRNGLTSGSTVTINNEASDNETDSIMINFPFSRLSARLHESYDLVICGDEDPVPVDDLEEFRNEIFQIHDHHFAFCLRLSNWFKEPTFKYQHVIMTSSDHVVFQPHRSEDGSLSLVPLIMDLSASRAGASVYLDNPIHSGQSISLPDWGYSSVVTIVDTNYTDNIHGNALGNFLSCSGGRDTLKGNGGSDRYVIKPACSDSTEINNHDPNRDMDVIYLNADYADIRIDTEGRSDLKITWAPRKRLLLKSYFDDESYQHIVLQTQDGILSTLPGNRSQIETIQTKPTPVEINKTPTQCNSETERCTLQLDRSPYQSVRRVVLNSNLSHILLHGNELDNYIDAGFGERTSIGGIGSDTYVVKRGYKLQIDNEAFDNKIDHLQLGLRFNDVKLKWDPNRLRLKHLKITSISQSYPTEVIVLGYGSSSTRRHLLVHTIDGYTFNVPGTLTNQDPQAEVLQIDVSTTQHSRNISLEGAAHFFTTKSVYGSLTHSNRIIGNDLVNKLLGGNADDEIDGGDGADWIEGMAGNDIIHGGLGADVIMADEGDDKIFAGWGDDVIAPGNGADVVDGGPGVDTVIFMGNVSAGTGVYVNLLLGFGLDGDAMNDVYVSVESVWGSPFNDTLIGNNQGYNELRGFSGDDILVPNGGFDFLSGGEGHDLYFMENATGVKQINNYDNNSATDTIDLSHLEWHNRFYRRNGSLHMTFTNLRYVRDIGVGVDNITDVEFNNGTLDLQLVNWYNSSKFRHLNFRFRNNVVISESHFANAMNVFDCFELLDQGIAVNVLQGGIIQWTYKTTTVNTCRLKVFIGGRIVLPGESNPYCITEIEPSTMGLLYPIPLPNLEIVLIYSKDGKVLRQSPIVNPRVGVSVVAASQVSTSGDESSSWLGGFWNSLTGMFSEKPKENKPKFDGQIFTEKRYIN